MLEESVRYQTNKWRQERDRNRQLKDITEIIARIKVSNKANKAKLIEISRLFSKM